MSILAKLLATEPPAEENVDLSGIIFYRRASGLTSIHIPAGTWITREQWIEWEKPEPRFRRIESMTGKVYHRITNGPYRNMWVLQGGSEHFHMPCEFDMLLVDVLREVKVI